MSAALSRDREDDDEHSRPQKRVKVDAPSTDAEETVGGETHCANSNCILPPSHVLLGDQLSSSSSCTTRQLLESDVGITEYISRDIPPVWGIIKQRCGLSLFVCFTHGNQGLRTSWCRRSTWITKLCTSSLSTNQLSRRKIKNLGRVTLPSRITLIMRPRRPSGQLKKSFPSLCRPPRQKALQITDSPFSQTKSSGIIHLLLHSLLIFPGNQSPNSRKCSWKDLNLKLTSQATAPTTL